MKVLTILILLLIISLPMLAEKGRDDVSKTKEGSTQLTFENPCIRSMKKNPVLVIYDRYDRSGAGVVYRVFNLAKDHTISIEGIPTGKYFVTILCLGGTHQRFETIVKIKSGKCSTIPISMENSDEFAESKVVIPAEYTDFSNLKVTTMR